MKGRDKQLWPRVFAAPYADALTAYLRDVTGVTRVAIAGDFRRAVEMVNGLDILVVAEEGALVMDTFIAYDEVADIMIHEEGLSSVILNSGLRVNLRLVPEKSFGAALSYFTGSEAHHAALRARGLQCGFEINEYGVYRDGAYQAGCIEDEVYAAAGLALIPPEIREDNGDIEAAAEGRLPELIEEYDIRGDLHMHTNWSDGRNTIEEMVMTARALGYEYVAVTDHSQRLAAIGGLDEKRLREQAERIDRLNEKLKNFTILKGIEADILSDGALDFPDSVLCDLDLVIGSIHSEINFSKKKQTERIMRAMDNPYFTILGHPTGRLLLERDPYAVDIPRLLQHARERGCFMELSAHPLRLDLNDAYCRLAKAEGVLVSINSDAHNPGDLGNMHFGVSQARRGWLTKTNVLNTRTLKELLEIS